MYVSMVIRSSDEVAIVLNFQLQVFGNISDRTLSSTREDHLKWPTPTKKQVQPVSVYAIRAEEAPNWNMVAQMTHYGHQNIVCILSLSSGLSFRQVLCRG